jgi:hypothetical protein
MRRYRRETPTVTQVKRLNIGYPQATEHRIYGTKKNKNHLFHIIYRFVQ